MIRPFSLVPIALALLSVTVACSNNDTSPATTSTPGADAGSGATTPAPSGALEAAVAACPQQTTLIQTADWTSCLAGKTLTGAEVFGGQACGLRFEADGALSYLRGGGVAIATPARASWKAASGSYQNDGSDGRRLFLASISPSLDAVTGQPRVTTITVSVLGAQAGQDSTVEVAYLDGALARQTYNCKLAR